MKTFTTSLSRLLTGVLVLGSTSYATEVPYPVVLTPLTAKSWCPKRCEKNNLEWTGEHKNKFPKGICICKEKKLSSPSSQPTPSQMPASQPSVPQLPAPTPPIIASPQVTPSQGRVPAVQPPVVNAPVVPAPQGPTVENLQAKVMPLLNKIGITTPTDEQLKAAEHVVKLGIDQNPFFKAAFNATLRLRQKGNLTPSEEEVLKEEDLKDLQDNNFKGW